jgi:hypothetical protein
MIHIVSNLSQATGSSYTHRVLLPLYARWHGQLMAVYLAILEHIEFYPCSIMVQQSVEDR